MGQEPAYELTPVPRSNVEKDCADADNCMFVENVTATAFGHQPASDVKVATALQSRPYRWGAIQKWQSLAPMEITG